MRATRIIPCLALLTIPSVALGQAHDEVKAAVLEVNENFKTAWNSGDAAGIAAVYAAEAVVMPPGGEPIEGRDAILTGFEEQLAGGSQMDFETLDLLVQGDLAVEVGAFVETAADGSHKDHGRYISVLKKIDGNWVIVRDIWNSSMSP